MLSTLSTKTIITFFLLTDMLIRVNLVIDDVRQILRKGVSILTLGDGELYDKSALTDPVKLIRLAP
ncbi:Uncharacterised protein [Shigella sonnei]|nr:Uncharacterised protein [Shigella sonnei]